jgi:hypothetical protein
VLVAGDQVIVNQQVLVAHLKELLMLVMYHQYQ